MVKHSLDLTQTFGTVPAEQSAHEAGDGHQRGLAGVAEGAEPGAPQNNVPERDGHLGPDGVNHLGADLVEALGERASERDIGVGEADDSRTPDDDDDAVAVVGVDDALLLLLMRMW